MSSRGVNKVILVGAIGKDPESRMLPSGGMVVNLSLATSESWKDKNTGQDQEVTEWHRLVVFGKLAEIVNQYVKKGSKLYVEGKLKTRQWDKDGVKMYSTEIVVNEMQLLDSKPSGQQSSNQQPAQQPRQQSAPQHPENAPTDFDEFDQQIPF